MKSKPSYLRRLCCITAGWALLALLLVPQAALTQEVTAAINGVITDPSGASVPGVKVTVKDLDRGTTFPATTDSLGRYTLPRLPVGTYEVKAEIKGFQVSKQSPVLLVLNQVAKIDFQLTVGSVDQTVDVEGVKQIV